MQLHHKANKISKITTVRTHFRDQHEHNHILHINEDPEL